MRVSSSICVFAIFFACICPSTSGQNSTMQRTDDSEKLLRENVAMYFPGDSFTLNERPLSEQFSDHIAWLSVYLRSIGEPPLPNRSHDDLSAASYRLTFIGFPTGKIVVLRLQISRDGRAKIFAKQTAYDRTDLLLNQENTVSKEAVDAFLECVRKADFWRLPSVESPEPRMPDGSSWYLEAAEPGHSHMVYRRTPELRPHSFTEIGRYLAKDLAQLSDSMISIPRADRSEPVRRQARK